MVAPSLVQASASQVSLPLSAYHTKLKHKVSISSIANTVRKRKFPNKDHPPHPHISHNYTKEYGPLTLSLNADHEASSGLPTFSNGAMISGSLEISKIAKWLHSIQIMVTIQI